MCRVGTCSAGKQRLSTVGEERVVFLVVWPIPEVVRKLVLEFIHDRLATVVVRLVGRPLSSRGPCKSLLSSSDEEGLSCSSLCASLE
jgi:hypothetical protein